MSVKEKWKKFGKSTGRAFANFGRAMKKTAKVVFTDEDIKDENGQNVLKESWKTVGKGFGEAGTNLGKAAAGTAKKVVDDLDEETRTDEEKQANTNDDVIDAEVVEESQEEVAEETQNEITVVDNK